MPLVSASHYDVNAYTLASQWLTALGWPNTPSNQRALAAWFLAESSHTGTTLHVAGNNPLNITTSTGNYRLVGTHKIAVYSSPVAGATAFHNLINTSGHNYPLIRQAFQANVSGISVIKAIVNSGWVTGGTGPSYWHTVSGTRRNLLLDVYNGLPGAPGNITPPPLGSGYPPTSVSGPITSKWQAVLKFLDISTDPAHVITADEAARIANAYITGIPSLGINKQLPESTRGQLTDFFTGKTVGNAEKGGSITPGPTAPSLDPIANAISNAVGGAIASLIATILPVAALIGGGVMGLFGIYLVTKEATGGSAESMVSPVPIFVREGA
jgi:hypothetical protein